MEVMNLTPYTITVFNNKGKVKSQILPSGTVARVKINSKTTQMDYFPITETTSTICDLPNPQNGVIYIVSLQVALCCRGRLDVVFPNEAVKHPKGKGIGCKSFGRLK